MGQREKILMERISYMRSSSEPSMRLTTWQNVCVLYLSESRLVLKNFLRYTVLLFVEGKKKKSDVCVCVCVFFFKQIEIRCEN